MKTEEREVVKDSACGATHDNCPNAWKGTCDRDGGHDGSHHCSSCNSIF